jgi:hypothetical protein
MNLSNTALLGETEHNDFQFPKSVMVTWWAPELVELEATPAPLTVTLVKYAYFSETTVCNVT